MLTYNEITPKKHIVLDGEPYEVLSSLTMKKNRQKPANQTRLRSLKSGKVIERAFHQSDVVPEADIKKRGIRYLYNNRGEYWFCDPDNPKERFGVAEDLIGPSRAFLKAHEVVEARMWGDEMIGVSLPVKIDLAVTEAPPAVRGNTAQGATKQITLESGALIAVPLFINEGDIVRINTETGAYVERVEKK